VERKKISLDDKLSNWLPWLPDLPHAGEVSLGNLISMTSGYRDFVPDPEFLKVNDTQPYKTWAPGGDPPLLPPRPCPC
jgi:CubicO group peptidase (beta-lactamase class C family)